MTQLASPHEVIQSFIAGLGDFIATLLPSSADKPTIPLYLYSIGTNQAVSWQADQDYYVRNVQFEATGANNATVSIDGSTYASIHNTGIQRFGTIIASTATNVGNYLQKTRVGKGQKLFFNQSAASANAVLIYLEPA